MVGRHYMFHNAMALVALSRRENPTVFQKTLSINDFYLSAPDYEFPLGNIQMIGKSQGPMFRDDAPRFAPGFTLDEMASHAVDFWLTAEDLALPQNRVTLNAQNEIQLHYEFTNVEPINRLRSKLQSMLEHMDMHPHLIPNSVYLGKHIPIAGVAHQAGTCRFGTDPRDVRPGRQLQGARTRQSLRRGHEFLSQHRRGESFVDGHRQRASRRRPSVGTAEMNRGAAVAAALTEPVRRKEIVSVYTAGVIQGVALVLFRRRAWYSRAPLTMA